MPSHFAIYILQYAIAFVKGVHGNCGVHGNWNHLAQRRGDAEKKNEEEEEENLAGWRYPFVPCRPGRWDLERHRDCGVTGVNWKSQGGKES
jgi:hypothetical protein